MGLHIGNKKRVIITEPKTIHFDLSKDVDNKLEHEIDYIIILFLAERTIKKKD